MFGMLDYRAYKLLWLFRMPVRLLGWVVYFAAIAAAIPIARSTQYALLFQVLIGYVAFEVMVGLASIVLRILDWITRRIFFFWVDVEPARGETVEEAKQIALKGDAVWLEKKLDTNIENWTQEDTAKLISLQNWRIRWFLNGGERIEDVVTTVQRHYADTGQHLSDMRQVEVNALVGPLNDWRDWVLGLGFRSLVAFAIIAGFLIRLVEV
jgi:hypothetical protein